MKIKFKFIVIAILFQFSLIQAYSKVYIVNETKLPIKILEFSGVGILGKLRGKVTTWDLIWPGDKKHIYSLNRTFINDKVDVKLRVGKETIWITAKSTKQGTSLSSELSHDVSYSIGATKYFIVDVEYIKKTIGIHKNMVFKIIERSKGLKMANTKIDR